MSLNRTNKSDKTYFKEWRKLQTLHSLLVRSLFDIFLDSVARALACFSAPQSNAARA